MKGDLDARLSTEDLKYRVDVHIHENRPYIIEELHEVSPMFRQLSSVSLSHLNSDTENLRQVCFKNVYR